MGSVCATTKSNGKVEPEKEEIVEEADPNIIELPFTKSEIHLLQKQWPSFMIDADINGIKVFKKIFELDQGLMSKFHFSVAYLFDVKKTLRDARMLFHVRRVVCLFDEVMESLSNPIEFDPATKHIIMVGMGHKKFGMKKENFQVFKVAMLYTLSELLGNTLDEISEAIWSRYIDLMISFMLLRIKSAENKMSSIENVADIDDKV